MKTRISLWPTAAIALLAAVAISGSVAAEQQLSRGKRWVRSHPFWLSALTQNPSLYEVNDYRGAGLNTLLAWKRNPVLFEKSVAAEFPTHYKLHQNSGETEQDYVEHVRQVVEKYPGCTGLLFHDEPVLWQMEKVGKVCAALKKAFPEMLVYSNAMPIGATRPTKYGFGDDAPQDFYAAYIREFGRIIQPDVVMIDIYPLRSTDEHGEPHSREYFEGITLVRQVAMELGAPYWLFIQAYDSAGKIRRPSESDLRFQLFAPLAYGFTGIAYFTYDPAAGAGLIDGQKNRTPLYYHAARANMEVANLGKALRFLESTGIAFVLGQHEEDGRMVRNERPSMPSPGLWTWPNVKGRPHLLLDVEVEGQGKGRDALLGFFNDDRGDEYFMVTNLWHAMGRSAADCAQNVTLKFASQVKTVTRLSRETGVPEDLVVRNGRLELQLPGGTGELFKIRGDEFPGLDDDH